MTTTYARANRVKHRALVDLANEFIAKYRARITQGLATYGEFDAATDKRNMGTECNEEILDVGSYLEMGEEMRPDLTSHIQKMRAKTIQLYGMGKRLEEMMKSPPPAK